MDNCQTLNDQFAIPGRLRFVDSAPGLPVAEFSTPHAFARVAVQGAQVLEWQPSGHKPVIWVSKAAVYQSGKGVRGGAPVCWPWFGGREGKGAHGFVRTRMWQVREVKRDHKDNISLRLGIQDDEATRALWDHPFDLELIVTVGASLRLELVTRNNGGKSFSITDGLHTYFRVGDINKTTVLGLENAEYIDKVRNTTGERQVGALSFNGEIDRVYVDTVAASLIQDPVLRRTIRVSKTGSASTVVWNPWREKEKGFTDMAAGEYAEMLCVETVNAGPDEVTVEPGGKHRLLAVYSVE